MIRQAALCAFLVICQGCALFGGPEATWRKVAMTEGMRLEADTPNGPVTVIAGRGTKRTYIWDEGGRRVEKTITLYKSGGPFMGLTGIYSPGSQWFDRTTRIVSQDAQYNTDTIEEAIAYIQQRVREVGAVYTSTGLLVAFEKSPAREQINVDVIQVLVNGRKPAGLSGAQDSAIRVTEAEAGQLH